MFAIELPYPGIYDFRSEISDRNFQSPFNLQSVQDFDGIEIGTGAWPDVIAFGRLKLRARSIDDFHDPYLVQATSGEIKITESIAGLCAEARERPVRILAHLHFNRFRRDSLKCPN